jgi:pseudaminic acid cytidylyltransferase
MSKCIAIITARGGSKRIPRKNLKLFLGKPIISYTIDTAVKANIFDEIMVSTDDVEIAEVSKKYGAKIPFFRSSRTSDDYSSTADVLYEVLLEYRKMGGHFKYACCIYPTAPLISTKVLVNSFEKLVKENASTLIPVSEFSTPIWRALDINNEKLNWIWPEYEMKRTQDLSRTYFDVGQFYWLRVEDFLESRKLLTSNTITMILPWNQIQDIDNIDDWTEAEFKYRSLHRIDEII